MWNEKKTTIFKCKILVKLKNSISQVKSYPKKYT